MMGNDFENEYREFRAIVDQLHCGEVDTDKAADKSKAFYERIKAKGNDYARLFADYKDARDRGNEYIDLNDAIWDENVPALIESMRNAGIDHFTFSSTWSDAVGTAWLFTENGCTLEGLTRIHGNSRNWETGEYDLKPAYIFSIH